MEHLSYIPRHFVFTKPTRFPSRALFFPFHVRSVEEEDLGDSTPQFSPRMQILHTREQGSDGLDLEEQSSESTAVNKIECVLITRKCPTTNLGDR